MKSLHLLSKFNSYVFNGLEEKWIWKLPPEILPVDLKVLRFKILSIDDRRKLPSNIQQSLSLRISMDLKTILKITRQEEPSENFGIQWHPYENLFGKTN